MGDRQFAKTDLGRRDGRDGGGPGWVPARCHKWVEFVIFSRLSPGVFLRVVRFSFLHKNQHSKFQFNQDREPTGKSVKAEVASPLNIVYYLFNYLFIYLLFIYYLIEIERFGVCVI